MTTIPDREDSCIKCVQSLVDIEPPFDRIVVNIPVKFMRMKKPYPTWAIEKLRALDPRVEVRRNPRDFGPGTKYFGFGRGSDEFTFICDDDKGYTSELLQALIRKMAEVKAKRGRFCVIQNPRKHKRLMGVHGLLCPPGCVKGYKAYLKKLPRETWEIDDDTFQSFIRIKRIPLVFLPKFYPKIHFYEEKVKAPHSLSNDRARRKRIQRALKRFLEGVKHKSNLISFK